MRNHKSENVQGYGEGGNMSALWMASGPMLSIKEYERLEAEAEPRELSFRMLEFMGAHHGEWPEWTKLAIRRLDGDCRI